MSQTSIVITTGIGITVTGIDERGWARSEDRSIRIAVQEFLERAQE
jgi:hypothetical protein